MKTSPIIPARICFDDPAHPGQPFAPEFGDGYHARLGAFAQARHVFLAGNGLPQRWQGRPRFVILETGFGLGNNFLATWAALQADEARPERLVYLAIEKHPPSAQDLAHAHHQGPCPCPEPALADALIAQWPPASHDLHSLAFEQGRVQLMLAFGDVATWLPELVAQVDAFYLDGFSPACNSAMWDSRLLRQLARLGSAEATAATWTVARSVREGLGAAGFIVTRQAGFGTKREMITARRRESVPSRQAATPHAAPNAAPNATPEAPQKAPHAGPPPGRQAAHRRASALVIGAGLAGAAAAQALAAQGLAVTVLERHPQPAAETSGNLAGLFHGVFHPQDGAHAQLLRAAALHAQRHYAPLLQPGPATTSQAQARIAGSGLGLLRGINPKAGPDDTGTTAEQAQAVRAVQDGQAMQSELDRLGLPAAYVQALGQSQAQALAGMALAGPAWLYPGGGWLSPPALVAHWLRQPGIQFHGNAAVARLQPTVDQRWQALDEHGHCLAQADVVVVAGARDGLGLLADWSDSSAWPLRRSRGQVTRLSAEQTRAGGWPQPRLPVASGGYLISLPAELGGGLLCGATNQWDDEDPALRWVDHAANLAQIERLSGTVLGQVHGQAQRLPVDAAVEFGELQGRVGWRLACDDKLPLVGPVPLPWAQLAGLPRLEQARQIPRVSGLYLLSALGSRGITLAPLLGEVLAAWITGAPIPVSASLLDAIDPARFVARQARRGPSSAC